MKKSESQIETGEPQHIEDVDRLIADISGYAGRARKANLQSLETVLSCIKVLQANSPLLGEDVLKNLEDTRKSIEAYAEELTSMEPEKKIIEEHVDPEEYEQVESENQLLQKIFYLLYLICTDKTISYVHQ